MRGTEKQIIWAENIKAGAYNALGCMERNAIRFANKGLIENTLHYDIDDVNAVRQLVVAQMESIEDAGTIIRIRDNLTQGNLEEMAKVHHKEGEKSHDNFISTQGDQGDHPGASRIWR